MEPQAIVDARGRQLSLRTMDPADMLDLIEAAGENAGNRAWLRFALLVCSVQGMDAVPVPFPRDVASIKSLARRLGTDGLEAVRAALFGDDREDRDADQGAMRTIAKN